MTTRNTQTTDKETIAIFTVEDIVKLTGLTKADLNKGIIFVTSGVTSKGWDIVEQWIEVGKLLIKIKAKLDKDQFKPCLDSLFGHHFNNNQRAYCQRLALQPKDDLKKWYKATFQKVVGCKLVFEKFCAAKPEKAVDAPIKKTPVDKDKKGAPIKTKENTKALDVSQAFTTYQQLREKCGLSGNLTVEALEILKGVLTDELNTVVEALELESKAVEVEEERQAA